MEDLSKYSGENFYKRPPSLTLNEVSLNGAKGLYRRLNLLAPKDAGGKYTVEELGPEIKVLFLKIRRKLISFKKGEGLVKSTNEHNSTNDLVVMKNFKDTSTQKGLASVIRETNPDLRTQQIVYALLLPDGGGHEVVRINVKGASLGSENKAENVLSFYDYLQTFEKDHFYEYQTMLSTAQEESPLGAYYAMNFKRGEALSPAQMAAVAEEMRKIHEHCVNSDLYFSKKNEITVEAEPETEEAPADEINPDEIPF